MFISIHTQGFALSDELKVHIEAKIRLMLGIYTDKIRRIDVFLSDVNGPKGGEDMMCKIKINAHRYKPIVVQETAENLREAVDVCSHRIKRSAGRRFDRAAGQRRVSRSFPRPPELQEPS